LWGRREQTEVSRLLDCGEAIQRAHSRDYAQGREKSVCLRHWIISAPAQFLLLYGASGIAIMTKGAGILGLLGLLDDLTRYALTF
jgi:hypothetical protein